MSYSRWGNSRWYTYWKDDDSIRFKLPTKILKRKQIFYIEDLPCYSLSYGKLEDVGMGRAWDDIRKFYWEHHEDVKNPKKPSETEMRELMVYIEQWRRDVDQYFKFWTFIKYEWYIPLINKIQKLWKRVEKKN